MPDIREEFEAWARPEGVALWPHPNGSDRYYCGSAQKAWEAWQASRAALKVKLPDALVPENNVYSKLIIGAYNALLEHVKEALQQAGIEVVK